MQTIILYIIIILLGFFITKKQLIPNKLKTKIGHLQNFALYFLLCFMGYKIGANDKIINNISQLGIQAIIITLFITFFSVLVVFLVYKGDRK